MYVRHLEIESLRCFASAAMDLQYPDKDKKSDLRAPNVNLLLGNNGSGKTSVLRAIALASLAPLVSRSSGYVPYYMVRRGKSAARIVATLVLHGQDVGKSGKASIAKPHKFELSITRDRDVEYIEPQKSRPAFSAAMFDDSSAAFLVVGYGASRRVDESASLNTSDSRKRRALRYQRIAGLFEPNVTLTSLGAWLPKLKSQNRGRHTQVVRLLNDLLPDGAEFHGELNSTVEGEYLFRVRGIDVPFSALSDGYRAYIGWTADLLYHVCMGAPSGLKLVENRGIVLVDELDLNLHPEWQRVVAGSVSRVFPNLQFVFSTHSPIVAGSLQRENVFVMEEGQDGVSTIVQFDDTLYGRDAQQILLSPYFGLQSTRAPGAVDEIRELSLQLKPGRPDIALAMMRKLTGENGGTANGGKGIAKASKARGRKRP
jgi:predicted ATPase